MYLKNPSFYELEPHLQSAETEHQIFAFQSSPAINKCAPAPVTANQTDQPQLLVVTANICNSSIYVDAQRPGVGGEAGTNSKFQVILGQTDLVSKRERKMKCEKEVEEGEQRFISVRLWPAALISPSLRQFLKGSA